MIDGAVPQPGEVSLRGGSNPRGMSPEFSTGASCVITWPVSPRFKQGVHKIELSARFEDSLITGVWFFRYAEVAYKQVRATVAVDSSWCVYDNLHGWECSRKYRMLSCAALDTAVFGNASRVEDSLLRFDTTGIIREYIDIQPHYVDPVPKDTLEVSIIQISKGDPLKHQWLISDTLGSYLTMTDPPLSIQAAVHAFKRFVYANNIRRGYTPPIGDLKLGPLFTTVAGDPGWSLRAYHDTANWFFVLRNGSGDCPCGCTSWRTDVFSVDRSGEVQLRTGIKQTNAAIQSIVRFQPDNSYWYNLKGQRIGREIILFQPAANMLLKGTIETGVIKRVQMSR
ncbi:MAG: hypothetical protein JW768_16585 [Chitinispirillaceae bacterium]|nr:hypothetical protein [Chitinispirillaceae bacterium]